MLTTSLIQSLRLAVSGDVSVFAGYRVNFQRSYPELQMDMQLDPEGVLKSMVVMFISRYCAPQLMAEGTRFCIESV